MPDREDVLRDETFKGQCDGNERRIFYTLDGVQGPESHGASMTPERLGLKCHRLNKAITGLAVLLIEKGIMSEAELDEWLLDVVR